MYWGTSLFDKKDFTIWRKAFEKDSDPIPPLCSGGIPMPFFIILHRRDVSWFQPQIMRTEPHDSIWAKVSYCQE